MKGVLLRLGLAGLTALDRASPVRPDEARPARGEEPLWLEWLALGGLLMFATWLLGARGVWGLLLRSDPTGITLVIIVVFSVATLWAGSRTRTLQRERRALRASAPGWSDDYLRAVRGDGVDNRAGHGDAVASGPGTDDSATALDLLLEHAHGPHATAWWVNGIQLKLGLLGKVIGFSILALDIGNAKSFDPSQSQELLRSLTTGLGVALLTTMVGLVANILLGLQLTRLDRYADLLVADTQRAGLQRPRAEAKQP